MTLTFCRPGNPGAAEGGDQATPKPKKKNTMTLPTIHLGGSSPWALMRQYEGALFALEAALTQMRAIDCDARDYYVQGPGVWEQAHAEHEARLRGVQEMIGAYNEILSHIHDSVGTALKEVR